MRRRCSECHGYMEFEEWKAGEEVGQRTCSCGNEWTLIYRKIPPKPNSHEESFLFLKILGIIILGVIALWALTIAVLMGALIGLCAAIGYSGYRYIRSGIALTRTIATKSTKTAVVVGVLLVLIPIASVMAFVLWGLPPTQTLVLDFTYNNGSDQNDWIRLMNFVLAPFKKAFPEEWPSPWSAYNFHFWILCGSSAFSFLLWQISEFACWLVSEERP